MRRPSYDQRVIDAFPGLFDLALALAYAGVGIHVRIAGERAGVEVVHAGVKEEAHAEEAKAPRRP